MSDIELLQERLGYRFSNLDILKEAITHKSFLNEARGRGGSDNERLEFLGDTVLDLVISTSLLERFPKANEGTLSKMKAKMVNETSLARVARCLELGDFLLLGKGEKLTNGRDKNSLLADVLEAVIAAIYLDSGLECASGFIFSNFVELFEQLLRIDASDYKSRIQEIVQTEYSVLPAYSIVREYGPDHQKIFEVKLSIRGNAYAVGIGKTKKDAEQNAARITLEKLSLCKRQNLSET